MRKYSLYILALVSLLLALPSHALAFCPLCTVAVGAGVGLARWLNVDDTITGLWVGGLLVSVSIWTIEWLQQKKFTFPGMNIIVPTLYYLFVIGPFYSLGIMGHPANTLWGIDKLLVGIIFGSVFFYLGGHSYRIIKARRGKAHFQFQKVVMPILPLVILTIVFYLLTK
jgi:hypothetical protein